MRRPYNTDRPSKTDSPYTIDAGVAQVEMDIANWTLDEYNVDRTDVRVRTLLIGQTNFKLGLTNWMDLQIFPQGYVERRTSGHALRASQTIRGFGDTTVRLKINLMGNDDGKLAIGLISSLKIPTNTNHLGNNLYEHRVLDCLLITHCRLASSFSGKRGSTYWMSRTVGIAACNGVIPSVFRAQLSET